MNVLATVAPTFGLIAVGYAAAVSRLVSEGAQKGISEFAFSIAIPVLLFRTIVISQFPTMNPLLAWGSLLWRCRPHLDRRSRSVGTPAPRGARGRGCRSHRRCLWQHRDARYSARAHGVWPEGSRSNGADPCHQHTLAMAQWNASDRLDRAERWRLDVGTRASPPARSFTQSHHSRDCSRLLLANGRSRTASTVRSHLRATRSSRLSGSSDHAGRWPCPIRTSRRSTEPRDHVLSQAGHHAPSCLDAGFSHFPPTALGWRRRRCICGHAGRGQCLPVRHAVQIIGELNVCCGCLRHTFVGRGASFTHSILAGESTSNSSLPSTAEGMARTASMSAQRSLETSKRRPGNPQSPSTLLSDWNTSENGRTPESRQAVRHLREASRDRTVSHSVRRT